jgi:hypothetical protein
MAKVHSPRYLAVYGAYVALQVRDRMSEGRGPPDDKTMKDFVEEAHTVAEMAEEVQAELSETLP